MLRSLASCFSSWKGASRWSNTCLGCLSFQSAPALGTAFIPEMLHYLAVFMRQKARFCVFRGGVAFGSWFFVAIRVSATVFGAWQRRQGRKPAQLLLLFLPSTHQDSLYCHFMSHTENQNSKWLQTTFLEIHKADGRTNMRNMRVLLFRGEKNHLNTV